MEPLVLEETRRALAAAWARVPERLRGPTQFLGRQYAGCGATIGAMPRCDFTCMGCYLGEDANRARPRPLADLRDQLVVLRRWLGPGGNVQLTDGELTLRPEDELIALIRSARSLDLVPMLMTHGETFRRKPGLIERLMESGGLTEISIHIDTTMRGRRDGYADARDERDLDGLRDEFAGLIRAARTRTGLRLEAASTVTVSERNLAGVPGIVRWFLRNADAFKMVSFQPVARVGRTQGSLGGIPVDALWERIADGAGDRNLLRGEGWLGHPACSRFVQGIAVEGATGHRLIPLYRRDQPDEMRFLGELLERFGGTPSRTAQGCRRFAIAARALLAHPRFAARRALPMLMRLLTRAGTWRGSYLCIVSHHFMSAAELATPLGEERLSACAFQVPVDGQLTPMCVVNATGVRERFYGDSALRGVT